MMHVLISAQDVKTGYNHQLTIIIIIQTLEDKLITKNYEKLKLALPEHPEPDEEEAPIPTEPEASVLGAVVLPPYPSLTRFTI